MGIVFPTVALIITLFLFSRRFQSVAIHFAPLLSIIFLISSVEIAIITVPLADNTDGASAMSTLLCGLSMMSYNQIYLLYAMIFNLLYMIIRTYTWLPT